MATHLGGTVQVCTLTTSLVHQTPLLSKDQLTSQPAIISLLSSTSHPGLSPLFTAQTDPSDPSRSIITSIPDVLLRPAPPKRKWDAKPDDREYVPRKQQKRGDVVGDAVHIQGSCIQKTYIQAGCTGKQSRSSDLGVTADVPLGVELPWLHVQLKRLGSRDMALEVGVRDTKGREGVIRISSSQKEPSVHPLRYPPLIHLPLSLPLASSSTLTPWLELSLNLNSLLPLFKSLPRSQIRDVTAVDGPGRKAESDMPNSQFGSVTYVRVYANCRLRRIWFTAEGETTMRNAGSRTQSDFALFSDRPAE